jgi:hypothetical protein
MKRAEGRYRKAWAVGSAVAAVLVVLSACSQQGEGDRCDFDNGDSDCGDGLICLPKSNQSGRGTGIGTVNSPYNSSDRCCPPDRTKATHPACTVPVTPTADAGTPADSGPTTDSGSTDSGSDASDASDAADALDAADADG